MKILFWIAQVSCFCIGLISDTQAQKIDTLETAPDLSNYIIVIDTFVVWSSKDYGQWVYIGERLISKDQYQNTGSAISDTVLLKRSISKPPGYRLLRLSKEDYEKEVTGADGFIFSKN